MIELFVVNYNNKYYKQTLFYLSYIMIKFVSDLRQIGGFLRVLWVSFTNKTDHHDISEILLKVALNTIA